MREELLNELEDLVVNELSLVEELKLLAEILEQVPVFSLLPSTETAQ